MAAALPTPHAWTLLLLAGLCCAPSPARAEEALSPARALFSEGKKLVAAGDYAAACPKFEESLRLEVGVGTQFNLADCWEHLGRTASAQALFVGAAASAKAAGQTDREQVLRERAAALETRLVRLVIETAEADPRLVIKRDELPLDKDSWGKAIAVDPGSYVIVAKAPGKKPWTKSVKIEAGSKVVTVEVPELELTKKGAPAAAAADPVTKPAKKALPLAVSEQPGSDRNRPTLNYKLFALGGVGLAAVGVGTVFALRYKSANDDAKAICPAGVGCTLKEIEEHDRLVEKATTSRTWTYVGFGVGGAALGTAAVLLLINGAKEPASASVRALPSVGQSGELGASVVGVF